ncbi:beta-lactamase-like protein [Aspergillus bertholletiae]|uniref:Beta-lactamase-like protein n=1 Tax=Aspergillus bertholletiae TaxID=1226010 RepID=A0A5N7BLJ2_9EURO|nr:beta-lactamase-like protein [Aspergillus bertholletiae]
MGLSVPPLGETVSVRIIDSTSYITISADFILSPHLPDFDTIHRIPCLVFLIEHPSGRKLLFDLGIRKDWQNLAPVVANRVKELPVSINVEKSTLEVLADGGVREEDLEGIIWSHWHWDHIGDPSTFPPNVKVIVGPGFKDSLLPGYPANAEGRVLEADFANRDLLEITDSDLTVQIGQFQAHDYFGDGSFYILSTPGHAVGHISGLARTSKNPDTFIFMGGDLCHHAGQIRPSPLLPLPEIVEPNPFRHLSASPLSRIPCPGSLLESLQIPRSRKPTEPFFIPNDGYDIPQAIRTIEHAQEADADDNVWFVYAHDASLLGVVDFYPNHVNNWKERNLSKKLKWEFVRDFKGAVERILTKQEGER